MNLTIMGIDPGTVNTGYGCIQITKDKLKCLDYGLISIKDKNFSTRVQTIHTEIKKLCQLYKPQHLAIEKVFFGKNADTAFKLGHIFALCLLESKYQGIEFFEYPSRYVKKTVTFSGNASKQMLQQFVFNFLSLPKKAPLDATDALAVALCHKQHCQKLEIQQQIQGTARL
ncbi:MAG: crossover junction endodeoxyribonuclease RuvC [Bdellovibrionaceae bacterium]|nr:crossover junction endodeoxyribonuclease RuvC [Pseudobdellovibrionaceae bacterium]